MLKLSRALPPVLALTLLGTWATEADAATTLRIATLAPKSSAWGRGFDKMKQRIEKKTDGAVSLQIYYNSVAGDEDAMVSKMRSGQLDGAALSSVGLSQVHKDVMVLQLPGVLDSWALLDKARKALKKDLNKGFKKEGFKVVGWGDIGRVRLMSKGFAVRKPADFRGKNPVMWRNEPMAPIVFDVIGGVTGKPMGPPEVLPNLRSGNVNILSAPPLAAEQLQWTGQLDHIGSESTVCAIGGMVMRRESLAKLDKDTRKTMLRLQRRYAKRGAKRIRKLDDAAYARLKKRMTVVTLTAAERAEWEKVLRKSVKRLSEGTFPKALVKRVIKISGKK